MRSRTLYCIRRLIVVLSICVFAGCWEEIEYRAPAAGKVADFEAPDPVSAIETTPPATNAASDEIQADNTAIVDTPATPQSDVALGDRYATTAELEPPLADQPAVTPPDAVISEAPPEPTSPTTDPAPPLATAVTPQAASTRLAAWILGSRLSLAALANDRGIAPEEIPVWLADARKAAKVLNVAFADLPARPAATAEGEAASRDVLRYLLEQGKSIGPQLVQSHGGDHAALFEVAMKSNLLLVLNKPGSQAVDYIAKAMTNVTPRTSVPAELWNPLLDGLVNGAAPGTIREIVRQTHTDVEQQLDSAVGP